MLSQSCSEVIILDSKLPNWADIVSAIAPTILGLFSLFIAIISILYTKKAIFQQKEQWTKDAFIKREADIVVICRDLCQEAIPLAVKMILEYMSPTIAVNTELDYFTAIKDDEITRFKDKFYKIEELVKNNRQLFVKYGLYDKLNHFHFMGYLLELVFKNRNKKLLPFGTIEVHDLNKNVLEEKVVYYPEYWFVWVYITYHHNKAISNLNPIYCREQLNKKIIEEYEKIIYKMKIDLTSLYNDFDNIMIIDKSTRRTLPSYIFCTDFEDKN